PGFGEDDYQIGLKYELPVFKAVGKNGLFIDEITLLRGRKFKEADQDIIADLKSRGRLYRKEMFVHSYPHCWRHHVPLMYYATDSWFIKTTSYKDKMIEKNKQIRWHPESFGTGRFGKWLEENRDWALSRNRFWGTPLPVWTYTDKNGKEHFECIGSLKELIERAVNFKDVYKNADMKSENLIFDENIDLHKPFIDEIIINSKDGHEMKRVKEVIDCWFDSGSMPFAQHHYPFENKELFDKSYPADFIAEGLDQTRGWFYTLHAIGTFLFDKPAYNNLIVNGMILDKNGKKMSKSLGNAVDPFALMESYGADILRWYLITSSPVGNSKLFNEDDLAEVQNKFFDTLINTVRFYIIYANLSDFEYHETKITEIKDRDIIDKWILSKVNSLKKNYFSLMDNYDITKAARILYDFTIDDLSNWYIRRNRKRLRNPENEKDKLAGYQTLYEVITELLKMVAPVSPFISEKLHLTLSENNESIHLSEYSDFDNTKIDLNLETEMKLAQDIVYLIRSMRVKNNLKVRQPLNQVLVPVLNKTDKKMILNMKDVILEEVNVKELNIIEGDSDIIVKKTKPNFKSIGPKFGKDVKKIQKIINNLTAEQISIIEKKGKIKTEGFEITTDDIEIYTENIEGWIVESYNGITAALDTKLNDKLIEEGLVREFINRVQNFRRNNDFDVSDKIEIYYRTTDNIQEAIVKNEEFIKNETLSEKIKNANGQDFSFFNTDINGENCEIYLQKIL
nr:class I tRNA ligase family protein [Ignavibacteria bacterium]